MINFLDLVTPEVDPVSNVNPIIVISIVAVLIAVIVFIGIKIKDKK